MSQKSPSCKKSAKSKQIFLLTFFSDHPVLCFIASSSSGSTLKMAPVQKKRERKGSDEQILPFFAQSNSEYVKKRNLGGFKRGDTFAPQYGVETEA